jgi:hypothetical protein
MAKANKMSPELSQQLGNLRNTLSNMMQTAGDAIAALDDAIITVGEISSYEDISEETRTTIEAVGEYADAYSEVCMQLNGSSEERAEEGEAGTTEDGAIELNIIRPDATDDGGETTDKERTTTDRMTKR